MHHKNAHEEISMSLLTQSSSSVVRATDMLSEGPGFKSRLGHHFPMVSPSLQFTCTIPTSWNIWRSDLPSFRKECCEACYFLSLRNSGPPIYFTKWPPVVRTSNCTRIQYIKRFIQHYVQVKWNNKYFDNENHHKK